MILDIYKYGAPVLRKKCEPVEEITPELKKFASDMVETMYEFNGIGLAAPQVGKLIRLIVVDPRDGSEDDDDNLEYPMILFNPEVIEKEGSCVLQEGCLSVPDVHKAVTREKRIVLRALDENDEKIEIDNDGILARVILHEIDHLDGKLFVDYLSMMTRLAVEPQLLKIKKDNN